MLSGLSPRRRALLLSLIALLVAGLATALVVVVVKGADRPRAGGPAARRSPGPVFLVPGYGGSQVALDRLAAHIRATGRSATVITLPGDGTGDLGAQARVLQSEVAGAFDAGADSVDVIGYSAGGVVVRLWLADYGGAPEARHVVTLGSPLHGARLAATGAVLVPGECPVACQQLVPGSALLDRLNGRPLPAGVAWMSVWTNDDRTVDPPDSARLDGAVNVVAQGVCPGVVISHGGLPTNPLVVGLVLDGIGPGPIEAPTAADCTRLRAAGTA